MSEYNYNFNILHEVVASGDQFPDKTHENVANNLFNIIQSSDRGVTIGLEGGWGSGKSTVVNLLRQQLSQKDDNDLFFLFDAWAHDGDPLRRIFLESLIHEIDPEGQDETLVALQQEISGRKKTVKVRSKKSTSKLGSWLSISAFFVPAGAAILAAIDYSKVSLPFCTETLHWALIAGIVMALLPLLTLISWLVGGEKDNKGFLGRNWDFFVADTTEDYTQDITEDGERTSIEFEKFFKQIMQHSISNGKKYKRALIVIDNLDRVDPDQTLAIWSILQTFFQHRSNSCYENENIWSSKLWFLVPYDREGLSQVWDKKNSPSQESSPLLEVSSDIQTTHSNELAISFLEKCFQIIAEVPEPVMSAWAEYAEQVIRGSLCGWPDEKVDHIVSTYKRYESRLESSPTPRQIQTFVNRVGMLGMHWKNEMSAEAIALYALVRQKRSDKQLRKLLLIESLPDNYEGLSDSYDLKKQLAGMLFGVNKDKGLQLLLEPEIRAALHSSDSDELRTLIGEQGEAFWIVWQAIKESNLPKGHTEEYRITVTKSFCGAIREYTNKAARDINCLIVEWKSSADKWELDNYDYSGALEALLNVVPSREELRLLLVWLKDIVQKSISSNVAKIDEKSFKSTALTNISKLVVLLESNGTVFTKSHYSKLDEDCWPLWIDALHSEDVDIRFILPAKGAIQAIASSIEIGSVDEALISLLNKTLKYIPHSEEWENVADSFADIITYNTDLACIYELMSFMYLSCNDKVKNVIEKCVSGASFNNQAAVENIQTAPALFVLCAYVHGVELLESNVSQTIKDFWQSEFEKEKCKPLTDLLIEQKNLSIVWKLASEPQNKVAIGIICNYGDDSIYTSPLGVQYFDEYSWASDDELVTILSKSVEYGGFAKAKIIVLEDPVVYRHCLKLIRKYGGDVGNKFVDEVLIKTTAVQWKEALSKDILLIDCINGKGNHEFKDGTRTFLLEDLEQAQLTAHIWSNFSQIYGKLQDSKDVAEAIANKYMNSETDLLNDESFNEVARYISEFIPTVDSDALMERLGLWLTNGKWLRIEWLLSTGLKFEDMPKESLTSRVNALLNGGNEEQQEILLSIAKVFNIVIDVESEDEERKDTEEVGPEEDHEDPE